MPYKINHRFRKLCGGMILVVFLLSGLAVLTGCAPAESGTTGGQDLNVSASTGWAIIEGNLWKTTDGGHIWKQTADRFAGGTAAGAGMNLNGAAFKNRGDLAFIWRGILYVLYGGSGEVKQLSDSGQAFYPTWSADGQWIAFLTSMAKNMLFAMPQGDGERGAASAGSANMDEGKLWLVSRDGRESRVIQGLPELPIVPARISWSPAGSILAVQGQGEIWLVPAKGEPYQVPGTEKFSGLSGWSPDGKSLACYSEPTLSQKDKISGERRMIFYSYNLDTGRLTTTGQLEMPAGTGTLFAAWRPDVQGMLYWPDPAYSASLAADGLELHSLRWGESQPQVLPCGLGYRPWLSFFPDGRLLMVAGGGRSNWSEKNLAVCELETGNTKILPNPAGSVAVDPALSPDGKQIAFVAAQNLGREMGGFSEPGQLEDWVATRTLWLENSDGSGAHPLKAAGGGIYQPSWSNDGTAILYVRDNSLWLVEVDSEKPQKIIGPFPDWSKDLFGYYGYVWHDNFAWFSK
ncbi:PD40 domain-containing protein [Desulfosporosinus youngiae]|uniref:Periplasmic component of the Tol biopolymer transport system n=1 Tax=Desulfosporosinus youngiae DSM 17734 TaxID=768710 RepID=H5XWS9_9FIRM|nr:PD40 domain-containing protein [Desulfosporosinus youngiae]EHQ90728.1 periplasmic component of the Tol biopolymer transport system [Desulfosporosinus youngiae DSM 17734]